MFSAKQGYDAVLDWGLNPGPPALNASTLPLGYQRGGRAVGLNSVVYVFHMWHYFISTLWL